MARDKGQILIYNEAEIELIKSVFADNEALLYTIRKVLLQFPLTTAEKEMIRLEVTPQVYDVLKKRIFPDLSPDSPLGQLGDIYQTLTPDLKVRSVEEMALQFEAKQIEIDYLEQQFAALRDISVEIEPKITLDSLALIRGKTPERAFVDTVARNFILGYIDPMLNLIKITAGTKTETVEEAKTRMTRDSNK